MIGYEFYNTMSRQWEYYEVSQRNSNQYRNPLQLDLSSLGNATSILQNRYNSNTQYLQQQVSAMVQSVYDLEITEEQKNIIIKTFNDVPLKSINTKGFNYSSLSETNRVINYLSESLSKIIRKVVIAEVTNLPKSDESSSFKSGLRSKVISQESYESSPLSHYYNNLFKVSSISQVDGTNAKTHTIKSDSYVILRSDGIEFKRADGSIGTRDFSNKRYNHQKKGYEFLSSFGSYFVHENLKFVEFYETAEPFGDNYTYYISN